MNFKILNRIWINLEIGNEVLNQNPVPWAKSAHRGPAHGQNWHAWLGPQHWHKIDPAARKRAGRAR
jgi:hypothetical protein